MEKIVYHFPFEGSKDTGVRLTEGVRLRNNPPKHTSLNITSMKAKNECQTISNLTRSDRIYYRKVKNN